MPVLTTSRIPADFTEATAPATGITINYVRGGAGPTLVLLHGYPADLVHVAQGAADVG